jgi:hypothetical protein
MNLSTLRRFRHTRKRGAVIRSIADKIGLVYFGSVDPRSDDHNTIRGITASVKHRDRHFAVGSYDGFDITMADRTYQPLHDTMKHTWCVLQINLHYVKLPYVLVTPSIHKKDFEGVLGLHRNIITAPDETWPHEFGSRFSAHTTAHELQTLHTILTPAIAMEAAVRLWPYALEIHGNKLYVYITEHRLTETVLGGAIESALWLADAFERQAN